MTELMQTSQATPARKHRSKRRSFLHEHSLSIASIFILSLWVGFYIFSNPSTHLGSFFGNAIADWSGVVVTVLATKYLYEKGSAESRPCPKDHTPSLAMEWLRDHSLSLFLLITGIGWVVTFVRMDPNAKWGQVVGNIVSEWTQIFGLVLLTKRMIERHSKESR
jgi:putative Mn2+ efflux pump MntP